MGWGLNQAGTFGTLDARVNQTIKRRRRFYGYFVCGVQFDQKSNLEYKLFLTLAQR